MEDTMQLFKVVVERKVNENDGMGEVWKDVRAYIVMAENEEEATHRIDPLFKDEWVRVVVRQDKSPYAYLLPYC
jgi:hypothetical protein